MFDILRFPDSHIDSYGIILLNVCVQQLNAPLNIPMESSYMTPDEAHYRIFKLIEAQPDISQRQLARELEISLGKVNYCLKALVEKGLVKARNFQRNPDKRNYVYLMTPKGIEEKARLTACFLKLKMIEYERLRHEIEQLRLELGQDLDDCEALYSAHISKD